MPSNIPFLISRFRVDCGMSSVGFTEVSGLNMEVQVVEYPVVSSNDFSMQKIPGLRKFSNVTLKRGLTKSDSDFFQWINTVALNNVERRNLTITMLDYEQNPVVAWKVLNAFPTKVDYVTLDAKSNDVAIQQIDLAIEGFSVEFIASHG